MLILGFCWALCFEVLCVCVFEVGFVEELLGCDVSEQKRAG